MSELIDKQAITLLISQLGLNMVTEVLDAFVPDAEANILCLQEHWLGDNKQDLRIKAHSLKSSAANLGFKQLSALAETLERHCLNHEQHEFNRDKDQLQDLSFLLQASIDELALMGLSQSSL